MGWGLGPAEWSDRMNKPPADVTRPGRAPDTGRGDPSALLRGAGCFTGDVPIPDALHIAFLRSPVAGRITALDTGAARDMPGVAAVHVGADVTGLGRLSVNPVLPLAADLPGFPLLAGDRVEAAGQAIAAVLAESPHAAQDAAEAIAFEIDEDAAPPPQRTLARKLWQAGDTAAAFAGADIVVDCTLRHARLAPTPLEPRAIAAAYDPATGGSRSGTRPRPRTAPARNWRRSSARRRRGSASSRRMWAAPSA